MFQRARYKYRRRSLTATVVLIAAIFLSSSIYVWYIHRVTRLRSYDELYASTSTAIESVEGQFRADRTMLRMISKVISESDDSLHSLSVTEYLNIYDVNSIISEVAVLLPDNKVIRTSGSDLDATGVLDFDEIKKYGEHISPLEADLEDDDKYDIRSFVPIRRDGDTIAFIYSSTTPDEIENAWVPELYGGHAKVSIIDRDSATYLIDSEGREGVNISEASVSVKQISFDADLQDAVLSGDSGYAIINDAADDDEMYLCYLPMDIANWEMVIAVPTEDVYDSVAPIRNSLYFFILIEGVLLLLYFIYILRITSGSIEGIERRANVDALTGLQNRNRYEYFCEKLQQGTDGLACIYIDVNGLHELNNSKGHVAGDNMLKAVAEILKDEYGEENTYRIGGDEFIAFRYDRDEAAIREDLSKVEGRVSEKGYHIACGLAIATPEHKLSDVIKSAEKEMYENKAAYYKTLGREMRK